MPGGDQEGSEGALLLLAAPSSHLPAPLGRGGVTLVPLVVTMALCVDMAGLSIGAKLFLLLPPMEVP